ncbi:Rieske (2Fe-2S) protein [Enemella evansiae]|uniref:Rieske (2Fe-2S) protein n=1 Tax=Enemella evansiae TaxID=2016499 RepID=A0A255GFL7_9ACTN|nr:Rieske (2Fe-2S) protein [Enemella evansiae]OYO14639.1 Rieske (2Fe-2S) protein [Enemella evansiae]
MTEHRPGTDGPDSPARPDRRQVLRGGVLAAAGLGVGLAATACGDQSQAAPSPSPTPSAPPVQVPKDKVAVGGGVVLEKRFVVTQPTAGDFRAFSNICPHGGCSVSYVRQQQIVCACHGSEFSIVDGSRTLGPARTGLAQATVTDDGDNLRIG